MDIVTLDDGRQLFRSSGAISGLLCAIAEQLPGECKQLKLWLVDVSQRPNGMMSIDFRGLPHEQREAIHSAGRMAYDLRMEEQHNLKTSHTFAVLEAFIQMQDAIRQGAPPEELTDCSVVDYPPTEENIYELWGDEDTT